MSLRSQELYRFGPFELDAAGRMLQHHGALIPLTPKAIDTLVVLVRERGRIVDREQLIREVWPDTFVEEAGLTRNISVLRKALENDTDGQEYIETIPKRGYRFVAPVNVVAADQVITATGVPTPSGAATAARNRTSRLVVGAGAVVLIATATIGATVWRRTSAPAAAVAMPDRPDAKAKRAVSAEHSAAADAALQRGRYYWNKRSPDDLRTAIAAFSEALDHDPLQARAYAGLADCYALLAAYSPLPASDAYPKARAAAERALALDESVAEAHTALAFVRFAYDWDWPGSESEYRRAIELKPDYPTAHQWYAILLMVMGRSDESLREIRTAEQLDPLSRAVANNTVELLAMARRWDDALAQIQRNERLFAGYFADGSIGRIYMGQGRYREALEPLQRHYEKTKSTTALLTLAAAHAGVGDTAAAEQLLQRFNVEYLATHEYLPTWERAMTLVALRRYDDAFRDLEQAYRDRFISITWLKVAPSLDPIRSDPRYRDLLRRLHLG